MVEELNVCREIQRLIFVSDRNMKKAVVKMVPKTLSCQQRIRCKWHQNLVVSKEFGENCSELSVGLVEKPDCLEV
jgi:hypothetical protein